MSAKRILVIEDNANMAFGIKNNLEIEGYTVVVAARVPGTHRGTPSPHAAGASDRRARSLVRKVGYRLERS